MKMVAVPYVQLTLRDVVVRIMECKHSCEVRDIALLLSHDVTEHVSHDITSGPPRGWGGGPGQIFFQGTLFKKFFRKKIFRTTTPPPSTTF
jgi:hypothetical protein